MSYWLYCNACEQWSKSATPLSDDKTCSFCHKKYSLLNRGSSDKSVIPDAAEAQAELDASNTGNVSPEAEMAAGEGTETADPVEAPAEQDVGGCEAEEDTASWNEDEMPEPTEFREEADSLEPEEVAAEEETTDPADQSLPAETAASKKAITERKGRMSKRR